MRILLAGINTGIAIFVGWLIGFGLYFSIAMSTGLMYLTYSVLLCLLILLLLSSVVAGWLLTLKKSDSLFVKFLAFLPVPFYLYTSYMSTSSELNYRYGENNGYCNEVFPKEYERPLLRCTQVKKGVTTGVIFYKDPTTGKRVNPPASIKNGN